MVMNQRNDVLAASNPTKAESGFSLIELVLTGLISSALILMAVPKLSGFLTNINALTAVHHLRHDITFARSESMRRHRSVRLCASHDHVTCDPDGRWEKGWIVYLDLANQSTRTSADPILKVHHRVNRVQIRKNGRYLTVKINAKGQISLNRSFFVCEISNRIQRYKLTLVHSGQLRTSDTKMNCPF